MNIENLQDVIFLLRSIGMIDKKELKNKLTKLQFEVTQNSATEPPFKNEYWNNKVEGIYIDILSGEPLLG